MSSRPPHQQNARPTMRDVAERAGVAVVTVSRVVNGIGTVREETAERVNAAISAIGYQRNEIARSLRPGQNSMTVGLLLGDLTNPFYASLAKAAVEVASQAGYAVLLSTADEDPEVERRAVGELIGRRVAGLIIVPDQGDHAFLNEINGHDHVPIVFVDRPATGAEADVVLVDNEDGGHKATQHLIDQGHRRIAILVAPSYYSTGRRLRGYRKALRRSGISPDNDLVVALSRGTAEEAESATHTLLTSDRPPTAVFSTTGFLTEGVLRACRQLQTTVALVGFDDFKLADMLPTPVTVVTSDTEELGRHAAHLLLDRINGDDAPSRRVVLPVQLIARGTGEIGHQ
ncbi:LacI family DNA-binding transcriptional regulator [Streptomyces sp. NBC_00258]|uniref:LacI family DNA-binding transcriptional regulator n=1 Tax=Streptomyces sp. NBC_00258 TaxID=2903642 RepID=UPI002E2C7691|nr:LacI family DNA-binding transcriptional regulator [Streptomyces sp. NBC_00258]